MPQDPCILFGIGAHKSGTSWLYDYLARHPQVHLRRIKELHYWDSIAGGHGGFWRRMHQQRLDREPSGNTALAADLTDWLDGFDGETLDEDFYRDFIGANGAGGSARLVGDITPSYALLPEKTFARMAALGPNVKFVYLMRDPVDRLWSHLRFDARGDAAKLDQLLANYLSGDNAHEIENRSNYRRTINRVQRVVRPDQVHFEFYERLFTPAAIDRLCAFLGLDPAPAAFDKRVNASEQTPMPAGLRETLETRLRPQYNFIGKVFGDLPLEWTERMHLA